MTKTEEREVALGVVAGFFGGVGFAWALTQLGMIVERLLSF